MHARTHGMHTRRGTRHRASPSARLVRMLRMCTRHSHVRGSAHVRGEECACVCVRLVRRTACVRAPHAGVRAQLSPRGKYSVRLFDITKRLHFVLYSSLANEKYGPTVRPPFRPTTP